MSAALIGTAHFTAREDGTPLYAGDVYFDVLTAQHSQSTFTVTLAASDTLATLQTKVLAAIDAEAQRLGLVAPTAVYGGAVTKLR